MKSIAITNTEELKSEIRRLTFLEDEQRLSLGQRFRSPATVFSAALTLFPKTAAARSVADNGLFQGDFLSLISRFLIPLTLNKTLFRRSNFIIKLMVGLASQKAASYLTKNTVENLFEQGKSLITSVRSKNKENDILVAKSTTA